MIVERARELRGQGYSYREISVKLNKSVKFIYLKTKDIKFDSKGEKRYNNEVCGITKRIKPQLPYLTLEKTRIIGHLLFDGMLCKSGYCYFIRYINSSKELIDQFFSDVKDIYGIVKNTREVFKSKKGINCYKITFKSKLIFEDLKQYFISYSTSNDKISIPKEIMDSKKEIKLEFLKTFFEDEGSISLNGRIMGDLKSEKIIKQIIKLLKEFGLEFRLCKYKQYTGFMWKIYLPKTKSNLKLFYQLGFFEKAIITHGRNIGKKKLDVLKENLREIK